MKLAVVKQIKSAPKEPGCYIFRSKNGALYVGKATNLRARLKSYLKITDPKTQALHKEANHLDLVVLRSEIEALLEESRLIKKLKPKYNVLWRDDKSYFYTAFTKEKFPRVFITHKSPSADWRTKHLTINPVLIGPFTDGSALRLVMKLLRRYFPYCTCQQQHLRECLNAQIGRCLGICCQHNPKNPNLIRMIQKTNSEHSDEFVDLNRYRKNIRMIKTVLRGNGKKLLKTLKDKKEKEALEKILEHRLYLATRDMKHATWNLQDKTTKKSDCQNTLVANGYTLNPRKIECYDISNMAGKEAVGVMTVLIKKLDVEGEMERWVADKSQWRKFKIKSAPTRDDPRMIGEILERRLNHPEWPYPDLIVIDGGITQYRAAKKVLEKFLFKHSTLNIKLLSYAKPQRKVIGMNQSPHELRKLIERVIYQTHRFAIRYHRQFRRKEFLKIN